MNYRPLESYEHLINARMEEIRPPYPKKEVVTNKGEKRDKKTVKRNKRNGGKG